MASDLRTRRLAGHAWRRSCSYRVTAVTEHPHDTRRIRAIAMPPTAGEAVRVYDVLLVMVSGVSVPVEEGRAHPPVAAPRVELAPGLTIGKLNTQLADLIANACEFRGHFYYSPHRPYGWRYDYLLEQPLDEAHRSRWDQDEFIRLALALSRFVRDNADSGQYAARVTEYADGELRVMPHDCGELRHVYRMSDPHDLDHPRLARRGRGAPAG